MAWFPTADRALLAWSGHSGRHISSVMRQGRLIYTWSTLAASSVPDVD